MGRRFLLQTANPDQWYSIAFGYGSHVGGGKQFSIWVDDVELATLEGPITTEYDGNPVPLGDIVRFYSNDAGTCKVYFDAFFWHFNHQWNQIAYPSEVIFDVTGKADGNEWDFTQLEYLGFWIMQDRHGSNTQPTM